LIYFVRFSLEIQKTKNSLEGPRIFKLRNLRGNQLIGTLAAHVFVPSVFGENIPKAEFGIISAETAYWDI
jgi:hypothetical protein